MIYEYAWGNNEKRASMKGRRCVVIAYGSLNSCLVEFLDNGEKTLTSTFALRKEAPCNYSEDLQMQLDVNGSD